MSTYVLKYPINETFFDVIDTEEKAYWLGFFTADGNVSKEGCICVGLAIKDIGHLEKLSQALESSNPIKLRNTITKGVAYPACFLRFYNKHMVGTLQRHGITPAKSLTVRPCSNVPNNLLRHYWRGVFDGDGSFAKHSGSNTVGYRWGINLIGSEFIVAAFRDWVMASEGVTTKVDHPGNHFRVDYGRLTTVQAIASLLYTDSTVSLSRKYTRYEEIMASRLDHPDKSYQRVPVDEAVVIPLYQELGTWVSVARHLDISMRTLCRARDRILAERAA